MGRYSPTVVPEVPDPLAVTQAMWSGYLGHRQGERAERGLELEERGLDIREQEAEARARAATLSEYMQGFRRGTGPQRVKQEALPPTLRHGATLTGAKPPAIGLQPSEREGLPALRDRLAEAKTQYEPQIVAKPGALIPGVGGFASRPITAEELQVPFMESDPQYQQVTPDTYFDPSGTREARMLDRQIGYEDYRRGRGLEEEEAEMRRRVQALIAAGVDSERATVEAMGLEIPGETTSGARPLDAMTPGQAIDLVSRDHWVPALDEEGQPRIDLRTGQPALEWDGTTREELMREAEPYMTGAWNDPRPSPEDISTGGIAEGPYMRPQPVTFEDVLSGFRDDPFGVRGGNLPEGAQPAPEPVLTDEQIAEMRGLYSDMEPDAARRELAEIGFTEADIDRIVGG